MATWTGTTSYATKKQLFSSISGLVDDINDLNISSISQVSTITATQWMSTPVLYVSDIQGIDLTISSLVSTNATTTNFLTVSSIGMKGFDSLLDVDVEFNFGLGQAIGGLLGGLGALVGGATIAVGTGAGLAIQGAEEGIATMVAGRPQNYINSNVYEQLNFQTQLQISTLGNDYPLYSSIFRTVSSLAPNSTPGLEILTSTFFSPGTTVIRSASDPFHLITGSSSINTSTIQSFGQWVAVPDAGQFSTFLDLTLSNTTSNTMFTIDRTLVNPFQQKQLIDIFQGQTFSNDYNFTENDVKYPYTNDISQVLYHRDEYTLTSKFISTNYYGTQSTILDSALVYLTSTLSDPVLITYTNPTTSGVFAICEPDETGFRSTGTMDFKALSQNVLVQWGLAIDNRNSTIGAGQAKRVTWDNDANTSNFIDIPEALSTTVNEATQQIFQFTTNPYEQIFTTRGTSMNPSQIAWDIQGMTFGSNTSLSNLPGYPYQFNSSLYVNGTIEAQTLIVTSTIFATSTFIENAVSTSTIYADYAEITKGYIDDSYLSSIKASDNYTNDYIWTLSRVRMAGFGTPMSLVVGVPPPGNIFDSNVRFDFDSDQFDEAIDVIAHPANQTLMRFSQSNISMCNLVVSNLITSTLVYSNATAPYIETSTINFGYTGDFSGILNPDYSLQQSLTTPPGTYWNNYTAASNQVLKIMGFSNTVNMNAQPFSTLFTQVNNSYGSSNIQGWASTIFANNLSTPVRVNLVTGAGAGQISFQAQSYPVVVNLNTINEVGGVATAIQPPSTIKFLCDGTTWTNTLTPPSPGFITYNNQAQITLDFETLNISTSDTLALNAETIKLNGTVQAPNLQLSNVYFNGFVSTVKLQVDAKGGGNITSFYNGPYNGAGQVVPMNYQFTVSSFDFLNIRNTVTPSRGFNLFNSYNLAEWNNSVINIDTIPTAGPPTIILGDVVATNPPFAPYSAQFWLNNSIDATPLNVPIYVNVEGVLSTIGFATGGGTKFTRVFTADGTNWSLQSNATPPQGITPALYNNYYNVSMDSANTIINCGMPLIYNMPSLVYNTNKTLFYSPQIRVVTIDAPTFNTREAGFEAPTYFDSNVIFEGGPETWQSDAYNPILNIYENSYYSVAGWMCTANITRIRTDNDIPMSWEIEPTPYPVGGGATDYVWGTTRYIQVRTIGQPAASIRERYLMIPKNYFNFQWQGQQGWI